MYHDQEGFITESNQNKSITAQSGTVVLLLKSFMDVLHDSFRGKKFTYRTETQAIVPEKSMQLWEKRGFEPSPTGIALVKFEGAPKEYTYPAYFWGE